jgi:hypothetical protein
MRAALVARRGVRTLRAMARRVGLGRIALLALAVLAIVAAVAIPALAASPSPSGGGASGDHPGKGPKGSQEPEVAVTLKGVVGTAKDADGDTDYTLTVDGKVLRLEAGPPWFWGEKHPLKGVVGKTVTIVGEQSGDEVDVTSIDGKAIREPGRPPWAGGPNAVGKQHPGWSQSKADRFAEKAKARGVDCWPPGLCKTHGPTGSEAPEATP